MERRGLLGQGQEGHGDPGSRREAGVAAVVPDRWPGWYGSRRNGRNERPSAQSQWLRGRPDGAKLDFNTLFPGHNHVPLTFSLASL